jgi:hypothetical protein
MLKDVIIALVAGLVIPFIKRLPKYIELYLFPHRRANKHFEGIIKCFLSTGQVPQKSEIDAIKEILSEQYGVAPCHLYNIYTVMERIYCNILYFEKLTEQQKMEFRDNFKKYARKYRERWLVYQTSGIQLRREIAYTMSIIVMVFMLNSADLVWTMNAPVFLLLIGFFFFSSVFINLALIRIFDPIEEKRRKKKAICSVNHIRDICKG